MPLLAFSAEHFQQLNMKENYFSLIYVPSVIGRLQCLREKRGKTVTPSREVTRKWQDVFPLDWQIHQYNANDISIIPIY